MNPFKKVAALAATGLFMGTVFVGVTATEAFAWDTKPTVTVKCDENTGEYVISYDLPNPQADWNSDPWKLTIESDTRYAFAPGAQTHVGGHITAVEEPLPGNTVGSFDNSISFYWTDGVKNIEHDTQPVEFTLNGDCKPPSVPTTVKMTAAGPNCDDTSYPVTVTATGGNTGTRARVRVDDSDVFDKVLQPGTSETFQVSIMPGHEQALGLYIGDNQFADDSAIVKSPSEQECHPAPPPPNVPETPEVPTPAPPAPPVPETPTCVTDGTCLAETGPSIFGIDSATTLAPLAALGTLLGFGMVRWGRKRKSLMA